MRRKEIDTFYRVSETLVTADRTNFPITPRSNDLNEQLYLKTMLILYAREKK